MQSDCNLVLYEDQTAIWASGTDGQGSDCYLTMQRDGNLVVYSGERAVWASNTDKEDGNYICVLQRDRNVVIYSNPLWSTGTYVGADVVIGVKMNGAKNGTISVTNFGGTKGRKISMVA